MFSFLGFLREAFKLFLLIRKFEIVLFSLVINIIPRQEASQINKWKFLLIGVKNLEKWKMIYWAGSSLMERWEAKLTPMSKSIPVVHQSKMDLSEVGGGGLKIKFGLLTTNNILVLQQNLSSTCSSGWRVWVCLVVCTSQISEFREVKWDGERKRERD